MENVELRVSHKTDPNKLGGAIVKTFDDGATRIIAKAMGAEAVNQLVKGLIVANQYLSPRTEEVIPRFGFKMKQEYGKEITIVKATLALTQV